MCPVSYKQWTAGEGGGPRKYTREYATHTSGTRRTESWLYAGPLQLPVYNSFQRSTGVLTFITVTPTRPPPISARGKGQAVATCTRLTVPWRAAASRRAAPLRGRSPRISVRPLYVFSRCEESVRRERPHRAAAACLISSRSRLSHPAAAGRSTNRQRPYARQILVRLRGHAPLRNEARRG